MRPSRGVISLALYCSCSPPTWLAALQAVQDALQAGDISPAQAESAKQRYAAIHQHFVETMAKEKQLVDEAKQLNEELQVSMIFRT